MECFVGLAVILTWEGGWEWEWEVASGLLVSLESGDQGIPGMGQDSSNLSGGYARACSRL